MFIFVARGWLLESQEQQLEAMKTHLIYIVDDNRINLRMIGRRLKLKLKCETRLFENARDCIRAFDRRVPDMVLTDYNLDAGYSKKMNGDRLLTRVKSQHPMIPVIVYSSNGSSQLKKEMNRFGADDFVHHEKGFFIRIVNIVKYHLFRMRERAQKRHLKRIMLGLILSVMAVMLFMNYQAPELLPRFMPGMLVAMVFIAFVVYPVLQYINKVSS